MGALAVGAFVPSQALASAPSSTPATSPATAHPWLHSDGAFFLNRGAVTIPRRAVTLVGGEWPYVQGQTVTVQVSLGGRVIKSRELSLAPSRHHNSGEFQLTIASPGVGVLDISVTHATTKGVAAFQMHRSLRALSTNVGFGSRGAFVELVQQRLAALHFYIPQTGVYDQGTGLAIDAYHRMLRWGTSQTLDPSTIDRLLDGTGTFHVRFPSHGRHAEGDLALQLLALANGSHVEAIYPISSGKPSTPTILGDFHVYSKVPGYLPDGMYYSNFFIRGYAIHGYDPAPDYPASHGCMRLPIVDATSVYGWLAIGDWVDTYY